VLGKAKVLGLEPPSRSEVGKPGDFSQCQTVQEIGVKLLQQVGLSDPREDQVEAAVAENDRFIAALQEIAAS
jgi:hypothetical protein